jgi:hypothetical protein
MATKNSNQTEAPVSANVKLYGQSGADILLTVRSGATIEDVTNVIDVMAEAMKYAREKYSLEPARKQPTSPPTTNGSNGQQAQAPNGGDMFAAETLAATVNDGKTYWKVKGGPYAKWGVTVWPEVLEAAGLTNLNPTQPVSLAGYVAHIAMKDNGKPAKVVKLERIN